MFTIISNQIMKMFLILILGFFCYRIKLIDHQGNKTLSNLLLMVVNPLLIFDSFLQKFTPEILRGFLIAILLGFLSHFVGIAAGSLFFSKKSSPDYNVEQFSCVYSNCGFMGIPLVNSIFGSQGVIYLTAYMLAFNVLSWTHGLFLITGNASPKQMKKGLTSPAMIGTLMGLVLFLTQLKLPSLLADTIDYITAMNTPMAMMIAGISLAETDFLGALKNKRLYLVSAVKLLLLPLVMLGIFSLLPADSTVLCTILIATACPAATTCTMFALRYNANYQYASEIFAFSTILSLATIPGMVSLAEMLL